MSIFFLLLSVVIVAYTFLFWNKQLKEKRNIGRMSSDVTHLGLVKPTCACRSCGSTSDTNLSQDMLKSFPRSTAIQKQILGTLKIMEHQVTEMEEFITLNDLNVALINQKPCKKDIIYSDSTSSD